MTLIELLRPVAPGADRYHATPTIGRPTRPTRGLAPEGATDIPTGGTTFARVPADLDVQKDDVIRYAGQHFRVVGVTPHDRWQWLVTLDTEQIEGDFLTLRPLTIGAQPITIGGDPITVWAEA